MPFHVHKGSETVRNTPSLSAIPQGTSRLAAEIRLGCHLLQGRRFAQACLSESRSCGIVEQDAVLLAQTARVRTSRGPWI
jgi:hypothetical protein